MNPPLVLYGHFYNPCIYESAYALQSLHSTKAGAYRAMRRAHVARYEADRDAARRFGRMCGLRRGDKFDEHAARIVRPVILND